MEHWKQIEQFPQYQVSDEGRVRNADSGHRLGIYDNGHGVLQVVLRANGKSHARAVHRLVAEAFLDVPPDDCVPMFRNDDRTDLRASNLHWKPRSFAIQWTLQGKRSVPRDLRRVLHVRSGVAYDNALECAKAIGGLEDLVLLTAQSLWRTTYMGSRFEFLP